MMKQLFIITTIIVLGCIFCFNAQAAITAVNNNDAQGLVQQLLSVSGGATTSNEIVTQGVCSGTFSDGLSVDGGTNFLIDEGIILSSGNITGISPPNNSDGGFFDDLGLPGDSFLNSLIPAYFTLDACVLEFDFSCPQGSAGSNVAFRYNFTSDEYNEWVGSSFNDVFGWQLNGTNIALLPDGLTPVAINNVNNGSFPAYYNDNDYGDFGGSPPYPIEADGFVSTLTATGSANLLTNHIKLAVGDAGDHYWNSWVMLEQGSFECIVRLIVDVKYGSNPNCVNPSAHGVLPVAFISSPDVDATLIDTSTLTYLGAPVKRCVMDDVDMDGIMDLNCKFRKDEMTGLPQAGDDCVFVPVSGTFLDGLKWEGLDHICVPGDPTCESGTPVPTP